MEKYREGHKELHSLFMDQRKRKIVCQKRNFGTLAENSGEVCGKRDRWAEGGITPVICSELLCSSDGQADR